MEIFALLAAGLSQTIQPLNILMMLVGLAVGISAGALPGITMVNAIVLVLPFTYLMGVVPALVLMIGIYCGGVYAGTITGILFNIPGDPMNVPQTWEGFQLNRQGQASLALGVAITTSAIGGFVSALVATFASFPLARVALMFSPVEYFAVVVLGLTSVVVISQASMTSAFISLFAGLFLATVGVDPLYGSLRFTFGLPLLQQGVEFVPVMIGLFAIGEVLERVGIQANEVGTAPKRVKTRLPRFRDLWGIRGSVARGIGIGTGLGAIPGAGHATVAAFLSYGIERGCSKTPERFGTGVLEGLAGPETAANATTGGSMIPLLTLGIPSSAASAVMLAAMTVHGLQPGPLLFMRQPALVYTIFAAFLVTNLVMVAMGLGAAKCFAQLLRVPEAILAGFIVTFCFLGAYAIRNDMADVWIATAFGVLGYLMRRYRLPVPPLILGLILGPLAEEFFRTAMGMHGNDPSVFVRRPLSAIFITAALLCLVWPMWQTWRQRRRTAAVRRLTSVLNLLLSLEEATCCLYATFARRFEREPALAGFWSRLSDEETAHVATLRAAQALVLKSPAFQTRIFPLPSAAPPDGAAGRAVDIHALLSLVHRSRAEAEAGTLGIDEAFRTALALERSEIREVFAMCLLLPPRPFSDVLTNLAATAGGHDLQEFAVMIERFSGNEKLAEEARRLTGDRERSAVNIGVAGGAPPGPVAT